MTSDQAPESLRRNVPNFDPTEYCRNARPPEHLASTKAKTTAKTYFATRNVDLLQATGTAHDDLTFDLLIALDPKAALIFSFIWNFED